jgi:hypothetical protein
VSAGVRGKPWLLAACHDHTKIGKTHPIFVRFQVASASQTATRKFIYSIFPLIYRFIGDKMGYNKDEPAQILLK